MATTTDTPTSCNILVSLKNDFMTILEFLAASVAVLSIGYIGLKAFQLVLLTIKHVMIAIHDLAPQTFAAVGTYLAEAVVSLFQFYLETVITNLNFEHTVYNEGLATLMIVLTLFVVVIASISVIFSTTRCLIIKGKSLIQNH